MEWRGLVRLLGALWRRYGKGWWLFLTVVMGAQVDLFHTWNQIFDSYFLSSKFHKKSRWRASYHIFIKKIVNYNVELRALSQPLQHNLSSSPDPPTRLLSKSTNNILIMLCSSSLCGILSLTSGCLVPVKAWTIWLIFIVCAFLLSSTCLFGADNAHRRECEEGGVVGVGEEGGVGGGV